MNVWGKKKKLNKSKLKVGQTQDKNNIKQEIHFYNLN